MLEKERIEGLRSLVLKQDFHTKHKTIALSIDTLFDTIIALYDDCKTSTGTDKSTTIAKFIQHYASVIEDLKNLRINADDFAYISRLAKGQFGEVSLVRGKQDGKVYAMKALKKSEMIKQQEIAFFMEERQILSAAVDSKWIVTLHAAFQDEQNLYLIMDFIPGGDLSSLLMRADEGEVELNEDAARFYIAEIVLALEDLHRLDYVHRDIKPGNVLIDARGHIKLADFGSCLRLENGVVKSHVVVGTPDYISPEVLQANAGNGTYGKECDFWSLGITLYELLVGDPPFYADSLIETYNRIMNFQKYLDLPDSISPEALDLIQRLICDRSTRLNDVAEIKCHPFFKGLDWENLYEREAPVIPKLESDIDTSNFFDVDEEPFEIAPTSKNVTLASKDRSAFIGYHLPFIGYTYNRLFQLFKENNTNVTDKLSSVDEHLNFKQLVSECELLRLKLEKESKRSHSLIAAHAALEADLKSKRRMGAEHSAQLEERESEISRLSVQIKNLETELANCKRALDRESSTKVELHAKIEELTKELSIETSNFRNLKDLISAADSEKTLLEKEKNESVERERQLEAKVKKLEEESAESACSKAALQFDYEQIQRSLNQEVEEKHQLQQQLTNLETQISYQSKDEPASPKDIEVQNELKFKEKELQEEIFQNTKLSERLVVLEKEHSNILQELSIANESKDALAEQVRVLSETRKEDGNAQYLMELSARAVNAEAEKENLLGNIKNLTAQIDSTEKQLKLAKTTINMLEQKLTTKDRYRTFSGSRVKLNSSTGSLPTESEEREHKAYSQVLEAKVIELKKAQVIKSVEYEDVKKRFEEMKKENDCLVLRVKKLDVQAFDDLKTKSQLEEANKDLVTRNEKLQKYTNELQVELQKMTKNNLVQESQLSENIKQLAVTEIEKHELRQKLNTALKSKVDLDTETTALQLKLNYMIETQIDPTEFANMKNECERLRKSVSELTDKLDALNLKYRELSEENVQLRGLHDADVVKILDLNRKLSASLNIQTPLSAQSASSESKKDRNTVLRLKHMEQNLHIEVTKRAALETELSAVKHTKTLLEQEVDDLKRLIQNSASLESPTKSSLMLSAFNLVRKNSTDSVRNKRLRPILFPDVNVIPVLQGWVKLRIERDDKKSKYTWEKRYAVLRHSKLYIYEKEKEKDQAGGEPLVDLRKDTFVVRAVKPMELIHLSKREISCVFLIQAVDVAFSSAGSLDNTGFDINCDPVQKLQGIITNILKEEKFKNASEKMLAVSTGDAKKRLGLELDECMRRLKTLRYEKLELEKALSLMPNTSNTMQTYSDFEDVQISETEHIRIEITKKEAYLDGINRMMTVVTNSESKDALLKQHSIAVRELQDLNGALAVEGSNALNNELVNSASVSSLSVSPRKPPLAKQVYECNGHVFRLKLFAPSTFCYHCGDSLFGNNQTLECSTCHVLCHKFCYSLITETCQTHCQLRMAKKWYFMAADEADRTRWVSGLDCVKANIKEELVDHQSLRQPSPTPQPPDSPSVDIDSILMLQ